MFGTQTLKNCVREMREAVQAKDAEPYQHTVPWGCRDISPSLDLMYGFMTFSIKVFNDKAPTMDRLCTTDEVITISVIWHIVLMF